MLNFISNDADRAAFADILQLEGLYPAAWDLGDAEGWAGLFTDDGSFDHVAIGEHQGAVITGRAALAAFARSIVGMWQGVHVLGLPGIQISGDTAKAFVPFSWCGIRRASDHYTMNRRVYGYYDVSYIRTSEGWRMCYRREKGTSYLSSEDFDVSP